MYLGTELSRPGGEWASQLTFRTQTSVFRQPRPRAMTSGSLGPICFRHSSSWKVYVNPCAADQPLIPEDWGGKKGHCEAYLRDRSSTLKWGSEGRGRDPHTYLLSTNYIVAI